MSCMHPRATFTMMGGLGHCPDCAVVLYLPAWREFKPPTPATSPGQFFDPELIKRATVTEKPPGWLEPMPGVFVAPATSPGDETCGDCEYDYDHECTACGYAFCMECATKHTVEECQRFQGGKRPVTEKETP